MYELPLNCMLAIEITLKKKKKLKNVVSLVSFLVLISLAEAVLGTKLNIKNKVGSGYKVAALHWKTSDEVNKCFTVFCKVYLIFLTARLLLI